MLNREAIEAAVDLPRETVACPEWGGDVTVTAITARERIQLSQQLKDKPSEVALVWTAYCLVDETCQRIFPDAWAGAEVLAKKSSAVVERLFEVVDRLNGLTGDSSKNESRTPSGHSPSASV